MTKNQSLSLIAFSAVLVLVGFQNCAKVGVTDSALNNNNKIAGEPSFGDDPFVQPAVDDPSNPPIIDDGGQIIPPIVLGDPTMPPVVVSDDEPAMPPVVSNDPPKESDDDDSMTPPKGSDEPMIPPVASNHDEQPPKKNEDHGPDKSEDSGPKPSEMNPPIVDDGGSDDIDDSDAAAICLGDLKALGKLKTSGPVLSGPIAVPEHGRGNGTVIDSDFLSSVSGFRGHLLIKGKTAQAKAELISNVHGGHIVICGMEVDRIEDSKGQLFLVNSTVHSLEHNGPLHLIGGSTVDEASKANGKGKKK